MSDEGLKKYIEDRTLADIMEDYGEQRDEWVTYLMMENGYTSMFRHANGKPYYCEQLPDYVADKKIAEILGGKTIEQQMEYYYVSETVRCGETSYGKIDKEKLMKHAKPLADYESIVTLLLKENLLVGAKIKAAFGSEQNLLTDKCVCTYYASDNNGSGTKDREDTAYLIFADK